MKLLSNRWVKYATLGVIIVVVSSAMSDARHWFRWWFRPPAPAIADVDFNDGDVRFSNLRMISFTEGVGLTQYVRTSLTPDTDPAFVASVFDQLLTFGGVDPDTPDPTVIDPGLPILLSSSSTTTGTSTETTTTTNVAIELDPTELQRTYFSSYFRTSGLATIDVTVEEIDSATGDPVGPPETTTIELDVIVFGSIHEHASSGEYHLRGSIRGYQRDDVDDTRTYTFLTAYLDAVTDVPVAPPEEE